ncbi:ribonuclease H-like domain-containing protein [Mycena galopus ATCC 62051]|nr:ribonuclease H-like domain-containing protein [Mycena galopus ATCC 62051]
MFRLRRGRTWSGKSTSGASARALKPPAFWLFRRKVLPQPTIKGDTSSAQDTLKQGRKIGLSFSRYRRPSASTDTPNVPPPSDRTTGTVMVTQDGESLSALCRMVYGQLELSTQQSRPTRRLALDCEMVGVGPFGAESALARVSIVNFHGAVLLDAFILQDKRVADYRTGLSGVRAEDLLYPHAQSFARIQARVAKLLRVPGRILVGHAVYSDLRALRLSHPHAATRDTQVYGERLGVVTSSNGVAVASTNMSERQRKIALKKLVAQEVGATIEIGEHSSVTGARASMAVYRLHRWQWDRRLARRIVQRRRSGAGKGKDELSDMPPVKRDVLATLKALIAAKSMSPSPKRDRKRRTTATATVDMNATTETMALVVAMLEGGVQDLDWNRDGKDVHENIIKND